MTKIPLPGLFPEKEPEGSAERKDFSAMDPDEYSRAVAAAASPEPNLTQANIVRHSVGLPIVPSSLERPNAKPGRVEIHEVYLPAHLNAARAIVRHGLPLYGLPMSKDRIEHRRRIFDTDDKSRS